MDYRTYENDVLTTIVNFDILFSRVNLTEILQNPSNKIMVAAASINSEYETGYEFYLYKFFIIHDWLSASNLLLFVILFVTA